MPIDCRQPVLRYEEVSREDFVKDWRCHHSKISAFTYAVLLPETMLEKSKCDAKVHRLEMPWKELAKEHETAQGSDVLTVL